MKQNHTDITIVLDRSGSMGSVRMDTIGGFNQFLTDQQRAPGTATFTLHQFDNQFETVFSPRDVRTVPPLTIQTFVPRGSTALLDAIGRAITNTGSRIAALPESERPSKVVFVIITDGEENASVEFVHTQIIGMITHQREKYQWEFVYLGANQDAIKTGTDLGMAATNSMSYAANPLGTRRAFASTSANMVKMRSGTSATMAYSVDDREAQKDAGAVS